MLLEAGAWLRPSFQNEVHLLAENGDCDILPLILNDSRCTPEIINRGDREGRTSVYIAAENGHINCLKILIKHGGDIGHMNNEGVSVIDVIFEQFAKPAHFFTEIFNNNISVINKEKNRSAVYNIGKLFLEELMVCFEM